MSRLGKVFKSENLEKLKEYLDEADLPSIPPDITIPEIEDLLQYLGNRQAYLEDGLGQASCNEMEMQAEYDSCFAKAYVEADKNMPGATGTMIKMVAAQNKAVKEADKKLKEARRIVILAQSKLKALQSMDMAVKKIANLRICSLEKGIA